MNLNFWMPTRILSGPGCVREGAARLATLGSRCLIVTGGSSAKASGALADCTAALDMVGIPCAVFDQVEQNPLLSCCERAGEAARRFAADFMIGIGGGSPLDAVKASAVFAANPDLKGADLFSAPAERVLPFALIGTTAGTGSEVTPYSVLTVDETGRKQSYSHAGGLSYARFSFSDPAYTATMPYAVTVSTGLDALCHAVEGYFSSAANELSDWYAIRAMELLLPALARLCRRPEQAVSAEDREALCYGALYGGLTINTTGTTFCHSLSYPLSEQHGVPHGKACAIFLPAFLEEARTHLPGKYARLWDVLRLDADAAVQDVIALADVAPVAPDEAYLHGLAERFGPTPNFSRSPGGFTAEKAFALMRRVYRVGSSN